VGSGTALYKSALELSDSVRCNERQSAIMMVRRRTANLKPGVFDAPLRGRGLPTIVKRKSSRGRNPAGAGPFAMRTVFPNGTALSMRGGGGLPTN